MSTDNFQPADAPTTEELAELANVQPLPCEHPRKTEQHFTYGYRWSCPDCKARGEDWWD